MAVLDATTTTGLERITVHGQYNYRAFGFRLLNNLVPIVLNVREPGPVIRPVILVFGPKTRDRSPYKDFGLRDKVTKRVLAFNIRHYMKCYLNTPNPEPYTFNQCKVCGASIKDQVGNVLQSVTKRSYRPDKYVWRPTKHLQSEGNNEIFKHHEGVI